MLRFDVDRGSRSCRTRIGCPIVSRRIVGRTVCGENLSRFELSSCMSDRVANLDVDNVFGPLLLFEAVFAVALFVGSIVSAVFVVVTIVVGSS